MTHNDSSNKVRASRDDFLAALYANADPALFLELRGIHPETAAVRTLWTTIGSKKRLAMTLQQADAMNRSGFGIYFAPCLRQKQKGSADAAAMLPALWIDIDCDDDPEQRETALAKLHAFDPAPSIILDSGGGWHAYWLLDQPYVLADNDARQHVANILHGLICGGGR